MTKTNDKLDEILENLVNNFAEVWDSENKEWWGFDKNLGNMDAEFQVAKQAIEAYIQDREVLAKIDELEYFMGEWKPYWEQIRASLKGTAFMHTYRGNKYPGCIVCGFSPGATKVHLQDRIAKLNGGNKDE